MSWRHRFVCLAHTNQWKIPTTEGEKDSLEKAGLGEKEIVFTTLNLSADEFKELLFDTFPKLRVGGGFQLLKCMANSRKVEVLSMAMHASPAALKQ
ncbi:MAG: hypothetical protein A6F71_09705 [Cycloclasticus sp. symbiont of Poecilosclerida sp. M]|nr:MAG: hypothetical protein A6F71_09705 [Cycloclasticus sp. symbiont of Poecilosclerida sp. M]